MIVRVTALFLLLACTSLVCSTAYADTVLTSEYFTGRIQAFDATTKAESTFATIGGDPGLSGLAYSQSTNTVYASALTHGGVYRLNAQTGAVLGFSSLGFGAGGLAVSSNGNVYVTDFGSDKVRVYDATLSNLLDTFSTPVSGTVGVGFLNNGDVLIATFGGVFRYDGATVTPFAANPAAAGQIATDSLGNTFIGHGLGFSDSVFRYDASGNPLGTIDITPEMLNSTGNGSSTGTSPGGVVFDTDGNLFIAVLGQSNPGDTGGERGGLFKFDVDGNLLDTFAAGSNAFSSVAYVTAVPEPGSLLVLAFGLVPAAVLRRKRQSNLSSAEVLA